MTQLTPSGHTPSTGPFPTPPTRRKRTKPNPVRDWLLWGVLAFTVFAVVTGQIQFALVLPLLGGLVYAAN